MWRVFIKIFKHYILCIVCLSGQSRTEAQIRSEDRETEAGTHEAILLKKILTGSVKVLVALSHRVSSRKPSGNVCGTKGIERD